MTNTIIIASFFLLVMSGFILYLIGYPFSPKLWGTKLMSWVGFVPRYMLSFSEAQVEGYKSEAKDLAGKVEELEGAIKLYNDEAQEKIRQAIEAAVKPLEEVVARLSKVEETPEGHPEFGRVLAIRIRIPQKAVDAMAEKQKVAWLTHALAVQVQSVLMARLQEVAVIEQDEVRPAPPVELSLVRDEGAVTVANS